MQKTQVTLLVHMKTKQGMGAKLEQAVIKLVPLTKSEPGCIEYNFHVDAHEPDSFLFYENWIDQAALDKHLQMPYLQEFKILLDEILLQPAKFTFWKIFE